MAGQPEVSELQRKVRNHPRVTSGAVSKLQGEEQMKEQANYKGSRKRTFLKCRKKGK